MTSRRAFLAKLGLTAAGLMVPSTTTYILPPEGGWGLRLTAEELRAATGMLRGYEYWDHRRLYKVVLHPDAAADLSAGMAPALERELIEVLDKQLVFHDLKGGA